MTRIVQLLAALLLAAQPLWAQDTGPLVPSPYRDLEFRQEWTTFAGYFNARHDPASVGPQGGLLIGERWSLRMGGPAYFTMRIAGSLQTRNVRNPQQPTQLKTERLPIIYTDAGIELQLTGAKTWHSLAPLIGGGIGMSADLKGARDVGGFRFGYPLTVTFGGAIKFVPQRGPNFRLDWSNYAYRLHYPDAYFLKTGTQNPILPPDVKKNLWRLNAVWTLGTTVFNFR